MATKQKAYNRYRIHLRGNRTVNQPATVEVEAAGLYVTLRGELLLVDHGGNQYQHKILCAFASNIWVRAETITVAETVTTNERG